MKYWQVNRIHPGSIIEEVLRVNLKTETSEEAVEILTHYGYEVIEIDEEWETIKVVKEADNDIKNYIIINDVTGEDVQRLYSEAWEVCEASLSCTKSAFIMYMMD